MNVWLWDAGERYSGVADSLEAAKEGATACLKRGDAARVERATVCFGMRTDYIRTGECWRAVRPWRGPMEWQAYTLERSRAS